MGTVPLQHGRSVGWAARVLAHQAAARMTLANLANAGRANVLIATPVPPHGVHPKFVEARSWRAWSRSPPGGPAVHHGNGSWGCKKPGGAKRASKPGLVRVEVVPLALG